MLAPDEDVSLAIEKPAAGGRMIARHEGQIVFVSGAIPGERVRARVEQVRGGNVFAHVAYPRQLQLKAEIVADAFARIGKLPLGVSVPVRPSPEQGYRMRARLHVRAGRIGFFREGTHDLCDATTTGQLLPATNAILTVLQSRCVDGVASAVREIELGENVPGTERVLLIELAPGARRSEVERLPALFEMPGVTGLVLTRPEAPQF